MVDAVRCAIEVQNGLIERNFGLPPERRIEFRVGIHLGDVVEESDGDLMGDGVNIAARLEGIAQPGEVCLSEDAYRQVREKLKYGFVNLGQKTLKNIARPIGVYALKPGSESAAPAQSASASTTPGPPHFSIVVLPFANMSGDPEQEYFVDGVTESLTTDLSRISGSFVIGRNTAFTYKGKHVDLKQIGRALNVRYVLEGSVQRVGSRMRVNVQLIDAETGTHLWAERLISPSPISSTCRTISSRAWLAHWTPNSPRPRRDGRNNADPELDGPLFSRYRLAQQGSDPYQCGASARLFRPRACRRPPQCRRAHRIGVSRTQVEGANFSL